VLNEPVMLSIEGEEPAAHVPVNAVKESQFKALTIKLGAIFSNTYPVISLVGVNVIEPEILESSICGVKVPETAVNVDAIVFVIVTVARF
jgi:hypothetical protein